ncbi:MAG: CDP-glucose 4,6-dehydratase [Clostridium sp.]|nr:CDP-glucose 4,6-dehydratase [Clostridium sp.]
MGRLMTDLSFYRGKRVFLTGHTGFKGSWLSNILINAGAEVTGFSLPPASSPALYSLMDADKHMKSIMGDIRDFGALKVAFDEANPEIVFHLAAQPIVRDGYKNPVYTYETNVMGTVYLLECMRLSEGVKSFLNVTTDKVYKNEEWEWGYRESEPLDGFDPYSNSKSCSELVTHSYASSFFMDRKIAISTARAGNVIGGGDFANDRILPDCIRAVSDGKPIIVRNPHSIRPYQHVLDPLFAYLMIASGQYTDPSKAGWYNVGPDESDCVKTGDLVDLFCASWGGSASWKNKWDGGPHEASFLKLDSSRIKSVFGWHPVWSIQKAVDKTCEWAKSWLAGDDTGAVMESQIRAYREDAKCKKSL